MGLCGAWDGAGGTAGASSQSSTSPQSELGLPEPLEHVRGVHLPSSLLRLNLP